MSKASEAQRLLERLLADAEFRSRFELDPSGAARAAGFGRVADDLAASDPGPLEALDERESRSSLAGALAAAAAEAFALVEVGGRLFGVEDAAAAATPANGRPWDADSYGLAGSGGPITPETEALLHNENVTFEPAGIADLQAGRIDPRVVAVITEISKDHHVAVTCTCSDHAMHTAGGSISNHYYGRGIDIGSVDGRLVNASNGAARELAVALAALDPSIRPSEIGSPWALPGAAYFTDGDHQDHLHVGFDDPIEPGWKPPVEESSPEQPDPPSPTQKASPPPQPAEVDDDRAGDDLRADGTVDTSGDDDAEDDSDDQDAAEAAAAAAAPLSTDPDDWEGNLDDEDAGDDEVDGSDEDEADEAGGEDDDGGSTSAESDDEDDEDGEDDEDDEEEDEDEGADEPGEGSNGEDATDDNAESGNSDDSSDGSAPSAAPTDPVDDVAPASDYPGDEAPREQVATWMGSQAQERGLPPELPVMASLVESGLRNLSYGDADSVGFFQMRTSIWDEGAYAGYQDSPELQLQWFLDRAEAVKEARIADGLPVDDPKSYGEWIADVERPAEQYRGRYQLRLDEAGALLKGSAVTPAGDEAQVLKAVDPNDAVDASG